MRCTSWFRNSGGVAAGAPRDVEIGGLDARRREQAFAECEHHGPVLARVGVDDGGDLLRARRHGAGEAIRLACRRRSAAQASSGGNELRAGEIGEDQLVRDREPAAFRARRQVMAGRDPELGHQRFASARPTRSTASPGSSSTSTNSKARAWACRRSAPGAGSRRREAAELLADLAALEGAMHGEDGAGLVLAERGREVDLLCGRRPGGFAARRPKRRVDVSGERLDRAVPLRRGRGRDDDEGREAEGVDADETGPEGGARLARECRHIRVDEQERAGHRPFARLGRAREHEGVGRDRGGWCAAA